jgi:hypothetical protein
MNQALYAHMNNKRKMEKKKEFISKRSRTEVLGKGGKTLTWI